MKFPISPVPIQRPLLGETSYDAYIPKLKWAKGLRKFMLLTDDARRPYARHGLRQIFNPEKRIGNLSYQYVHSHK